MYAEVTSLDDFASIVEGALEEYNNTHKNRMNLVIFRSDSHIRTYLRMYTCSTAYSQTYVYVCVCMCACMCVMCV